MELRSPNAVIHAPRAMPDLIVVVPVYNEEHRLTREAWSTFVRGAPGRAIWFVDDGSTDGTPEVLESIRCGDPAEMCVIRLPANAGKAEAVRQGMARALDATSCYAGFADADLSAPLDELLRLADDLDRHPAAWTAWGSRVKLLGRHIVRSERRHYVGRVFATFASLALSLPVYDTQCGLKLFRNVPEVRAAFAVPFRSRWIFDVELLARLMRAAGTSINERVREVPLETWQHHAATHLRVADYLRAPLELWVVRRELRRRARIDG